MLLLAASADGPIVLTAAGTRPLLLLLPLALLLEGEGPPRELAEMICDRTLGPPAGRCRMAIAPAKGSGLRPPSARALRGSSLERIAILHPHPDDGVAFAGRCEAVNVWMRGVL